MFHSVNWVEFVLPGQKEKLVFDVDKVSQKCGG